MTIGILIALRQSEELKNHIRIGITNGGKSTRDRQDALLSRSAPASLQWLAQRQALWPPEYCRARWIDVREMA